MFVKKKKERRGFLDYFPAPKFLEMPATGLAISDSSVRFVEFEKIRNSLTLGNYAEELMPPGTISGGFVNNQAELVKILRRIKEKFNLQFVRTALPEEKAYLFKTTIPTVPDNEIRSALEFKIEENAPIAVSEAVFDYTIVKRKDRKKDDHINLVVSVLPIKVVNTYLESLHAAGLQPLLFEIESQAIARSVIPKDEDGGFLIMNLSQRKTSLYIVSDNVVQFTSTVSIGSESLKTAPTDIFVEQREGAKTEKNKKYVESFLSQYPGAAAIKDEIEKLYNYWHGHKDEEGKMESKIKKIIICGDDSYREGLVRYLSFSLEIPVELANVWANVFSFDNYVPDISYKDSLRFSAAIGLTLSAYLQ